MGQREHQHSLLFILIIVNENNVKNRWISLSVRLAQSVEHKTLNLGVVSSTLTIGGSFTRIITQSRHLNFINSQNVTELHKPSFPSLFISENIKKVRYHRIFLP